MKRAICVLLAGMMTLSLAACGGKQSKNVDLTAYFDSLVQSQGWDENYMADMPDDMLDTYYPGLRDIETRQFIAKAPMMSAVVNEIVLMECTSPEDAQKAADILNQRVTEQADGGAWYPASIEAWANAMVTVNDSYAALIAAGQNQDAMTDAYLALFAEK